MRRMTRFTTGVWLLQALVLICMSCKTIPTEEGQDDPPNIVLIFSDDHAWTDYGFMGHEFVQTPHLDKLAAEGTVYTRGYVPTSICRPSLMTLATGLYPHQHKITGNDPAGGFQEARYPREELLVNIDRLATIPKLLAEKGYLSHQSGKWWEGDYTRGGFTHGMTEGRRHGDKGLTIGREGMDSVFQFIDYAMSEEKPFYLWYAPFLPHTPHTPPDSLFAKYSQMELSPFLAKYYAMVEWLDLTIGELIQFLDDRNLRENTLIYYLCDNGWIQQPTQRGFDVGSKQTAMDGGVRTPIIFSWPGRVQKAVREELISSIDLFPTILSAAGLSSLPDVPGIDHWPELIGAEEAPRRRLFGEGYGHNMMDKDDPEASLAYLWCIDEDWKLILCYDGEIEGWGKHAHDDMRQYPVRLYNIVQDPFEKNNLAAERPEIVQQLRTMIEEWYPLQERRVLGE